MILLIAFGAFVSTLLGGLFALRAKDKLHLVLGFSAGAVIAVAFFDLMPESLDIGSKYYSSGTMLSIVAAGFLGYLILDRLVFFHAHTDSGHEGHGCDDDTTAVDSTHMRRGIFGAGTLCIHSFLDGVAIGLAFQVSTAIGAIVAVAVLAHDFSDGINTVNLVLKNKGEHDHAFKWLIGEAVAPILGAASTLLFTLPENALSIILALFSGFFLYIGASDLVPESHHAHPKLITTAMTVLAMTVMYFVIKNAI